MDEDWKGGMDNHRQLCSDWKFEIWREKMGDRPITALLQALKSSLAAAIKTCNDGSQESQPVISELRSVLLALLDCCSDAAQGL